MAKKKKILTPQEERILRKKKVALELSPEERAVLERRVRELEAKLGEEMKLGKKMVHESEVKAEEEIRKHPLPYVFGAFVAGMLMGKLLK